MNTRYTIKIASIVSLGGFLYGFDASVISGVIGYVAAQYDLSAIEQGWVVSSTTFAAMFSMLTAGYISTLLGRKKVLIYVALLYTVSALGSALATSYELLVIARMIGGLAFGAALILAPVYIAEVSPAERRGRLVSIQQLNLVVGLSAAYFSNYFLQSAMQHSSMFNELNIWRWMLAVEAVPAILYFFLLLLVPKSPRWLLLKGREQEASRVLDSLFGAERAEREKRSILENINQGLQTSKVKIRELFNPQLKLVMAIGITIGIVQMITGINAIFYYANTIFEQSGVGTDAAFSQAVLVGIVFIAFTILSMLAIDKFGRKPLLLIGLFGVIVSLSLTAYGFGKAQFVLNAESIETLQAQFDTKGLQNLEDQIFVSDLDFKNAVQESVGSSLYIKHQNAVIEAAIQINPILVLVGILGFIASFAMSLGPVMWVLLSEIFPTRIRGLAISFIGFINSTTSTLVTLVFPWQLENLGNVTTFSIYVIFAAVGLVLLARLMPETKGKSLEDLEAILIK